MTEPRTTATEPSSGCQFELRHGSQRLVAVEVGAELREYEADGRPILDGFPIDRIADGARGQPLLPWPNRLGDGRYEFNGQQLQVPIDEVERHNAIHGLTRWLNWRAVERTPARVRLQLMLHARPGYPFCLSLELEYVLSDQGLTVSTSAHNVGAQPLPFGAGQHPYFSLGAAVVDELTLTLPSHKRLELDEERRLPTGRILESDDFCEPRVIGPTHLDECYCDLDRDADGRIWATLRDAASGRGITVWGDSHYKYLQVF